VFQITYFQKGGKMRMKGKEFLDKDVYAEDEKIGKVKEIEINLENWKVTHLEVELTKDAAESVLGAKKHGVRNMLATSALESGVASWNDRGLNLRIPKAELHAYLKPVAEP
jgi:sporulation protein YlmC with PRC-barrel domain